MHYRILFVMMAGVLLVGVCGFCDGGGDESCTGGGDSCGMV